jgi:hypothetical protein
MTPEECDLTFGAVVFGTDLSGSDQVAGRYAAGFARHYNAELIVSHVAAPSHDALAFRHILYASDFSPAAAHAAPYAISLARAFGSEIDLLHGTWCLERRSISLIS